MSGMQTKIGAGVTLVALGGLAGYAVNGGGSDNRAATAATAGQPVEVRTQTIHRTVRVVKHEKPRHPRRHRAAGSVPATAVAPARVASAAPPPSAVATGSPLARSSTPRASTPPAPARHPVTTRTSGGGAGQGGGGEREHEHEHEGGDD